MSNRGYGHAEHGRELNLRQAEGASPSGERGRQSALGICQGSFRW
jgi:hypothetical protein